MPYGQETRHLLGILPTQTVVPYALLSAVVSSGQQTHTSSVIGLEKGGLYIRF